MDADGATTRLLVLFLPLLLSASATAAAAVMRQMNLRNTACRSGCRQLGGTWRGVTASRQWQLTIDKARDMGVLLTSIRAYKGR